MLAAIDRVRISGPAPTPREIAETRKALQEGRDICRGEGNHEPSLNELIWRLFKDATETLARLPDRERTWLLSADRSAWPDVLHTPQEHFEAEVQRLTDLKMSKEEVPLRRPAVNDPTAPRRMLTVLGWLRYVRAKRVKRDKLVILAMAHGHPWRFIKSKFMTPDVSDFALIAIKGKVLKQISEVLISIDVVAHPSMKKVR